jgi:hypothetical protein
LKSQQPSSSSLDAKIDYYSGVDSSSSAPTLQYGDYDMIASQTTDGGRLLQSIGVLSQKEDSNSPKIGFRYSIHSLIIK